MKKYLRTLIIKSIYTRNISVTVEHLIYKIIPKTILNTIGKILIKKIQINTKITEKNICYFSYKFSHRVQEFIDIINKDKKIKIYLVTSDKWECMDDNIEIIRISNKLMAPLIINKLPTNVVHAHYGNILSVWLLIHLSKKTIILDYYDTHHGVLHDKYPFYQIEKEVIEKVKFISHRDTRLIGLSKNNLIKIKAKKQTLIPDPINNKEILSLKIKENEIHVVNCGWIDKPGRDGSIFKIIQALIEHNIYFHFYPSRQQSSKIYIQDNFQKYIYLSKKNKYFQIHEPIYDKKIFKNELNKYQFGINCFDIDMDMRKKRSDFSDEYIKNAGSSRLMTYLESGLIPILSPSFNYQCIVSERYSDYVVFNEEFINDPVFYLNQKIISYEREIIKNKINYADINRNRRKLLNLYSKANSEI